MSVSHKQIGALLTTLHAYLVEQAGHTALTRLIGVITITGGLAYDTLYSTVTGIARRLVHLSVVRVSEQLPLNMMLAEYLRG